MAEEIANKMDSDQKLAEEPMIKIVDMHKWYGEFHVLKGINLSNEIHKTMRFF